MRITKLSLMMVASALLSGCVTRVLTADTNSNAAKRADGNTVLLVPVLILPSESGDDRNAPEIISPDQSGRPVQAQLARSSAKMASARSLMFLTHDSNLHFIAIPLAGAPIQSTAYKTKMGQP